MTQHPMETIRSNDPYTPAEIAVLVEKIGVKKAHLQFGPLMMLAVLAGVFIALGAMFFTVAVTGAELGFGINRVIGGVVFSTGLILVVVGGAELFTGNNLIVMAWAGRQVATGQLLRNWSLVYIGNFAGAVAAALLVHHSGTLGLADGAVLATATRIAQTKVELPFVEAFVRGILCNILVCLAVWLSYAARHVAGKILAIVPPIAAFVALGFEHSVANMYFIPLAIMAGADGVTLGGLAANLVPVTLGNIVGGGILVAFVFWVIYLRNANGKDQA